MSQLLALHKAALSFFAKAQTLRYSLQHCGAEIVGDASGID